MNRSAALSYDEGLRKYLLSIYNFMGLGLLISGFVAFAVASLPALSSIVMTGPGLITLAILTLILVFVMSSGKDKYSTTTLHILYWTFMVAEGAFLSVLVKSYTSESIISAFLISSTIFGSMSLYGYVTKRDMTGWGVFLFMMLVGLLLVMIVNLIIQSTLMGYAISGGAVLLFSAITAYDTQRLKVEYYQNGSNAHEIILGALTLYLNFINIFIHILNLFGIKVKD